MPKSNSTITARDVLAFIGMDKAEYVYGGDDSVKTRIPVREIFTDEHVDMFRFTLLAGLFGKLGNVSKGGLKQALGRDATDDDLAKARDKVVAAWKDGSWNVNRSGPRDNVAAEMLDAFIAKQVVKGKTVADVRKAIKATVSQTFGDSDKATFSRYLDAVATIKSKRNGTEYQAERDALESAAMEAVEAERKRKADAGTIDIDVDELF